MEVTKQQAISLSAEIKEAVDAILAKHGLSGQKVKTAYGEYYKFSLEAFAKNEGVNGVNLSSKEATYFTKFGYTAYTVDYRNSTELVAPLGTKFSGGTPAKEYVFAGISPTRRKYPIAAIDVATGATVFFPDTMVAIINRAIK